MNISDGANELGFQSFLSIQCNIIEYDELLVNEKANCFI